MVNDTGKPQGEKGNWRKVPRENEQSIDRSVIRLLPFPHEDVCESLKHSVPGF